MRPNQYDIRKLLHVNTCTVKDLIKILQQKDQNANVSICGSEDFYIHTSADDTIVTFDHDELCEAYTDDILEAYSEFIKKRIPTKCYCPKCGKELMRLSVGIVDPTPVSNFIFKGEFWCDKCDMEVDINVEDRENDYYKQSDL